MTIAKIRWPKAARIISSRFPTIDLFEDVEAGHIGEAQIKHDAIVGTARESFERS